MEVAVDCRDLDLLDAYLDRELDEAESASVRDHLGACATCRQHVADRESLGRLIRRAPYYTAPARLKARLPHSRTRALWPSRGLAWTAAALLVASLTGSMLLWSWSRSARTANSVDTVAEAIVDSHVRALMEEHLFDVRSTDQHTVKPWFLGKLDFSPPVDDLARLGFPLAGGRLDYVAGRPAAALVYTRAQHTINLFVWPEEPANVGRSFARSIRGFHVRHWTHAGMSFWAVSDLNDTELDQFARALQS
jgi:anti-sigma factor RsiW